mmetsp:Transcript_52928/g.123911  ORF Transcript_52928/g.123911 Transcript_52928/m.123911 type:complete len:107 (-) Transcript_52928:141-461(-)
MPQMADPVAMGAVPQGRNPETLQEEEEWMPQQGLEQAEAKALIQEAEGAATSQLHMLTSQPLARTGHLRHQLHREMSRLPFLLGGPLLQQAPLWSRRIPTGSTRSL